MPLLMFEECIHEYIFSGSLPENASTYVKRKADDELYEALQQGKFCYVLNSRQSGKSSLRLRTMSRLSETGVECASIDLSSINIQGATQENWYADLITILINSFVLDVGLKDCWERNKLNSPLMRFTNFLEKHLLVEIEEPVVIFIDEIDSVLSLNFPTDDFFAFIRACHNQRVDNPAYKRLTFCLLGVASPSNLIQDKQRTPFNIGKAISLKGFKLEEVEPLERGLRGKFNNSQAVMQEILNWTGGQPFLTQKLCQFMVEESENEKPRTVEQVVFSRIIESWESQDEPEHLRTIRARILRNEERAAYLLELYQQIRLADAESSITADNTIEQSELLLSGLVARREGKLKVYNAIYKEVFNQNWIENELNNLRPYSENFRFWVASGGNDESRLLRGKALADAEKWANDKNLSYQDKQFLAASREKEIQEKIAAEEREARLERERKDKEAAEQRNQVLSEANIKAKRRIRNGTVVLMLALSVVGILAILSEKEITKAKFAREEVKQAQKAQQEAENREKTAINKIKIANQQVVLAEEKLKKAQQEVKAVNKKVEQADQQVVLAEEKLKKSEQEAKAANKKVEQADQQVVLAEEKLKKAQLKTQVVHQQVEQANQQVYLAEEKLKKSEQEAKAANKKVQEANHKLAYAKLKLQQTNKEIQNVSLLSSIGSELYKNNKRLAAEKAWKQASLSLEIRNNRLKQAMLLNDISIAYQQLGKLTEANKAVSTSLKLLEADVDKRNSSDKLVLLAQAFHIKGNLLKVKGDIQEASSAYTKALDNLESLSNDLTHINPAIQISLSGIAKGIYREKISTFFTKSKKTRLSQQNLEKVRQITESLYSAELYNYPHINFKDTDFLKINQIDSKAAVVYPILLQDSLEIIFHLPGKNLRHYSISIPKADVKNIVRKLKRYSNSKSRAGGNEIFQKASLQIYNWLIKPIESELQTSSVKTLVFVMDRELGNIPMASLYDGKQYLVEKYALALTPSLQVIEPQPYARRPLEAVIAGVVNFKGSLTLPYVQKEIANISSMIPSSIVLLNEAFTIEALKKAIDLSSISIVHFSTHGKFSSKPEDTFIQAGNRRITAKKLYEIFKSRKQDQKEAIELVVFASSESSVRHKNALWGFAGVVLRTEVRSILGTLSRIDDRSTALLMDEFYRQLTTGEVTKAEALRLAQLKMLQTSKYKHPYYWANYVLVGNWL